MMMGLGTRDLGLARVWRDCAACVFMSLGCGSGVHRYPSSFESRVPSSESR